MIYELWLFNEEPCLVKVRNRYYPRIELAKVLFDFTVKFL